MRKLRSVCDLLSNCVAQWMNKNMCRHISETLLLHTRMCERFSRRASTMVNPHIPDFELTRNSGSCPPGSLSQSGLSFQILVKSTPSQHCSSFNHVPPPVPPPKSVTDNTLLQVSNGELLNEYFKRSWIKAGFIFEELFAKHAEYQPF